MKAGTTVCPEIPDWLAENLQAGDAVGIDPFLHTVCCSTLLPPSRYINQEDLLGLHKMLWHMSGTQNAMQFALSSLMAWAA